MNKNKKMLIAICAILLIGGGTTVGILTHRNANEIQRAEVSSTSDCLVDSMENMQDSTVTTTFKDTTTTAPETVTSTTTQVGEQKPTESSSESTGDTIGGTTGGTTGGNTPVTTKPAVTTQPPVATQAPPVVTTQPPVVTEPPKTTTEQSKPAYTPPTGNFSYEGLRYKVDESAGVVYQNQGSDWVKIIDGGVRWDKFKYVWDLEPVKDGNTAFKAWRYVTASTVEYAGCDVIYVPSYWTAEDMYNNYGMEVQGRLSYGTYVDSTGDGYYWYYD